MAPTTTVNGCNTGGVSSLTRSPNSCHGYEIAMLELEGGGAGGEDKQN